ncbi:phosphonate C-P lyase system protein PhnG [Sinorhizobium mexicanum]|uniref:Phosphonate C-P lyase system protein PhnG n=1 Tax=Sinorhizobium mexicanum TaxID=375549 RepID=A0A859QWW1_9HYPH|nr:phosphonate C-P lyase system protein PhnG [Sinorhizobium mexicanum]MBP1887588.1 alpha-D-ribose 1-methylphosphonate 5-triphosphate synthase subunit PhnG [Sinorhizobium mexicanum]QLL63331.1 phosphonate C-P lyase system protein PhnG [Sinorhizobium mexicanum]
MTQDTTNPPAIGRFCHGEVLDILAASRPAGIKACAEVVLDDLGDVSVLTNRTGLAMLPFVDTVRNTNFHLGEVLVAEAHIRIPEHDIEGYGAVVGRDLEHAMAMAVIDAAIAAGHETSRILQFLESEQKHQNERETVRLKKVEATRVEMETF